MINVLLPLISTVIDRVVPDKNGANKAKQAIEAELIANATQLNLAQAETNKIEAAHRSIWVAGWRLARLGVCIKLCLDIFTCTYHTMGAATHWQHSGITCITIRHSIRTYLCFTGTCWTANL